MAATRTTTGGAGGWPYLVVDRPAEGAVLAPEALIGGWAVSPAGVSAVAVTVDGQALDGVLLDRPRPDVAAAYPQAPGGARSGWHVRLPSVAIAPVPRDAELIVTATDGNGRVAETRRRVRLVAHAPAAATQTGPLLACDHPAADAPLSTDTVIRGWAFGSAEIEEIAVWLDGELLGAAVHGRARPDVAADHPGWPQAARSGFWFCLPAAPRPPLPRGAELRLVARDRAGARVEVRRPVRLEPAARTIAGSLDVPPVREPLDPLRESGWSSPLVVYGWAADPLGVERVEILVDDQPVADAQYGLPREDVETSNPDLRRLGLAARSGWQAVVPTEGIEPGEHRLAAVVHGGSGSLPLGPFPVWLRGESARADPVRQRRLDAVLRCPRCGGTLAAHDAGRRCTGCGRQIAANDFGTLLFEETYAGLDWRDAGLTSHGYPQEAIAIVLGSGSGTTAEGGGLVLDIGAGLRENLPNVIQTDAIAYPTTDVSADAARLPFADESFDGVIACNLLEHVATPADVVREMRRVCKIGGRLYADCTSVHPYHGFPHHYSNATVTGLDHLMRESGGAKGTVAPSDNRIAIKFALESWLNSLQDPEARQKVEGSTVADLLALIDDPQSDPARYQTLGDVFADGRLLPPKVAFAGVRER